MIELFVIYALTVAVFYALGNVIDKVLFSEYIDSAETMQFVGGILSPIGAIPVLLIDSITLFNPFLFSITLLSGFMFFIGGYLQMHATKLGEVSNMTLLLKSIPIFSLILGAIFLSERLSLESYIGFGIIICASVLVALDFEDGGIPRISPTVPNILTVLAAFLFGAAFVMMRFLLESGVSVVNVFFWSDFGGFLLAPLLIYSPQVRQESYEMIRNPSEKGVHLLIFSIFLYAGANLINTFALNEAPAALVSAIVSADALFVVLIIVVLSKLGFDMFEEPLTKKSVFTKSIAGILFIIGAVLLS